MYRVTVNFGHCDVTGGSLPSELLQRAARYLLFTFTQSFGGAQTTTQVGAYRSAGGLFIPEVSTSVWSFAKNVESHRAAITRAARRICRLLRQECVLLSIEYVRGSMDLVSSALIVEEAAWGDRES